MRTCPWVLWLTSCITPYPCFSPSASASRMWKTAGVKGNKLSGFDGRTFIFFGGYISVADISVKDIDGLRGFMSHRPRFCGARVNRRRLGGPHGTRPVPSGVPAELCFLAFAAGSYLIPPDVRKSSSTGTRRTHPPAGFQSAARDSVRVSRPGHSRDFYRPEFGRGGGADG